MIRQGLERFRAAGIVLDVKYYDEEWILGHSMLHGSEALAGEGVHFDGTILDSD